MYSAFLPISAPTNRLIILAAASLLLLAAGDVSQAVNGKSLSDAVLAPAVNHIEISPEVSVVVPMTEAVAVGLEDDQAAASAPASLSALVASVDGDAMADSDADLNCLATAVYFESRGEPMEGQLAVAQTILNRVESGRYAPTVCSVINQPKQFSYDRSRAPRAGSDWETARAIAHIAMQDMWHEVAPRAVSFHARRVAPNWAGKTRIATIGNHIFYR
jgi:spore germination cell wall hydrolase CwlJ-like protein